MTSGQRATNFSAALHQGGAADNDEQEEGGGSKPAAEVTVVGEPGKPKKKGAKLPSPEPDSRENPGDTYGEA